ncbi:hypothetical protein IFM89_033359 [Coptis chinensis]|uniref:MULE transposase domain-containing protein n=1 Tax=Coptis chinensis TaxID=261450 RepID=A0A835HIL8_9MAGN|nr:hypothetical protein IFM89_033359 [Coptis chinensis]
MLCSYGIGKGSTSGDNSSNSYSSSCASGSGTGSEIVPIKELRSRLWAFNLKHVGQTFVDANDFRLKESTGCLWRVHAVSEFDSFVIKTMHSEHSCGFVCKDINSCFMSSKLVENLILEIVRGMPLVKPKDLMTTLKTDYGLDITYYYVYTAKKMALEEIHGIDGLCFHQLKWLKNAIVESNPRSRVILDIDSTKKFERMFICFEASSYGFNHCRPIVYLDCTFLKNKHKGCLLAATAKNGNQGIFPLAIAIVVNETDANWFWFIEQLKLAISSDRILTFLSDRHVGLVKNIPIVFPGSFHSNCLWHLKNNVGSAIRKDNKLRKYVVKLFFDCAYAASHHEFFTCAEKLKKYGGLPVQRFLEDI